jgi:hypothetical protein
VLQFRPGEKVIQEGCLPHAPGAIENENFARLNQLGKIVSTVDHEISLLQVHKFVKILGVVIHKFIKRIDRVGRYLRISGHYREPLLFIDGAGTKTDNFFHPAERVRRECCLELFFNIQHIFQKMLDKGVSFSYYTIAFLKIILNQFGGARGDLSR